MALAALYEIAEASERSAAPKSRLLRFTLAYLFEETGAKPDKEWLFHQFWTLATSEPNPRPSVAWEEYYSRSRGMTSCMRGIISELGFEDGIIEKLGRRRSPEQRRPSHDESGDE